jgi:hypothetical protein
MAASFRRNGSPEALPDPFGGPLRQDRAGTGFRAWSQGMGGCERVEKLGWKRAEEMLEALNRGCLLIELPK